MTSCLFWPEKSLRSFPSYTWKYDYYYYDLAFPLQITTTTKTLDESCQWSELSFFVSYRKNLLKTKIVWLLSNLISTRNHPHEICTTYMRWFTVNPYVIILDNLLLSFNTLCFTDIICLPGEVTIQDSNRTERFAHAHLVDCLLSILRLFTNKFNISRSMMQRDFYDFLCLKSNKIFEFSVFLMILLISFLNPHAFKPWMHRWTYGIDRVFVDEWWKWTWMLLFRRRYIGVN